MPYKAYTLSMNYGKQFMLFYLQLADRADAGRGFPTGNPAPHLRAISAFSHFLP